MIAMRGGRPDKKSPAGPSFESCVGEYDSWFDKTLQDLEARTVIPHEDNKGEKAGTSASAEATMVDSGPRKVVLDREFATTVKGRKPFLPAPVTFLDGLASQKAKELKGEEAKKKGGGHSRNPSFDLKKLRGKTPESLATAATAAGVPADLLQYALNSLPQLTRAEEDDKRTVFWRIADDYFRRVDRADLLAIKNFLRRPREDPAFMVPAVGKRYRAQWQDEERVKEQLERAAPGQVPLLGYAQPAAPRAASPAVKSRSKAPSAPGVGKKAAPIVSVVCPKPEGTTQEQISELCDVCYGGDSQEGNVIVFCDNCNVAVHQACYGIAEVPKGEWLCNKCAEMKKRGLTEKQAPSCVLCPVRHGALKPANPKTCITCTGEPSKRQEYVHLFCSQWIPETFIGAEDTHKMEPVQNLKGISKDRFKLLCSICKQRHGACIQCSHGLCATAFHPLCARAAGLAMEVVGYENSDDVDLRVYCHKHSKRPVKRALEIPQTPRGKAAQPAAPTPKKMVKEPAQEQAQALEATRKGVDRRGRPIDMVAELEPKQCASLLRQVCAVFGIKTSRVAQESGVEASKLNAFLFKKSALSDPDSDKVLKWVRKFSSALLGPSRAPQARGAPALPSPSPKMKEGPPVSTSTPGAPQPQPPQPSPAPIFRELPRCFRNEVGEYMHMYTDLLLRTPADSPPVPPSPKSPEKSGVERKGRMSKDLAYALACSPESETMGEIFVMQHELARQMLVNRKNLKSLMAKVAASLPAEAEAFYRKEDDMRKVEAFIEASKEAKRLLKRERRAEQQKQNLAAAEAAVAQSTRHSAGRSVEDFYKPQEEVPQQRPDVYTKDEHGNDVIYDKYSIQKTDQDLLCSVCGQGHSEEPNQIVFCEMCDLAVHQRCYGIKEIPEGEWLCWPCKEHEQECLRKGMPKSQIRKPRYMGGDFTAIDKVKCVCCPVKRGAFKKTKQGEWCHVVCAMWNRIPIADEDRVDAIGDGVKDAILGSQNLTCSVSGQQGGAIIKCNYGHCQTFFYPLCARAAGFVMPVKAGVGTGALVRAYCGRHGHLVQQQQSPAKSQPVPISPMLVEHINWLETSISRLRQTRQELERLRLISDVLLKREKTKTSLLRAEQGYITKCLRTPKAAKEFEEKMQNPQFAHGVLAQAELAGQKRKHWGQGGPAKHARVGGPVVERQRVMTVDQARATNVKLPPGYLYVPLDFPSKQKK